MGWDAGDVFYAEKAFLIGIVLKGGLAEESLDFVYGDPELKDKSPRVFRPDWLKARDSQIPGVVNRQLRIEVNVFCHKNGLSSKSGYNALTKHFKDMQTRVIPTLWLEVDKLNIDPSRKDLIKNAFNTGFTNGFCLSACTKLLEFACQWKPADDICKGKVCKFKADQDNCQPLCCSSD